VYLLKKAIKLNHEFLADSAALEKVENISLYQQILLSFSSGEQNNLVNLINYQSIKKRFTVMKKQPSKKAVLVRTFIFLPLLALLLYSFSSRETVLIHTQTEKNVILQEKATPEMVARYNAWAKAVKAETGEKVIAQRKLERMRYIFSIMSPEQKKNSESFPEIDKEDIVLSGRNMQQKNQTRVRENQQEKAALRQQRQSLRQEERKERMAVREERETARLEKRQAQMERRRMNGEIPPPPPPPAPTVSKDGDIPVPPPPPPAPELDDLPVPPPPPPSPEEAVKKWMEEGAEFYLNGKKVSGKEALKAVQENNGKNLSVQVQDSGSGKTVRISDNKR
jgi:hypothetical protein